MYADLQRFLEAVEQLLDLWHRKLLRFEVSPRVGVSFVFDEAAEAERPAPGGGLYNDLEDAIDAVASGTAVEAFVTARSQPRLNFRDPESPEAARQKYEAVERLVAEAHLEERVLLTATSKLPILAAHEWEVVNREADSSRRAPAQKGRYAILRLTAERLTTVGWDAPEQVTVLALDADRVSALLEDLTRLSQALIPQETDVQMPR